MTSKNNSKNAVQTQDLIKRQFRVTPDNDALINEKATQYDLSRAQLLRHCLDFCKANDEALDAFITDIVGNAKTNTDNADNVESTNSTNNADAENEQPEPKPAQAEPAQPTPGTPLVQNKHLNSLILGELNVSSRNLERFAHTAQQNRLNSVASQSMEISNRLKHIRDVLENK